MQHRILLGTCVSVPTSADEPTVNDSVYEQCV